MYIKVWESCNWYIEINCWNKLINSDNLESWSAAVEDPSQSLDLNPQIITVFPVMCLGDWKGEREVWWQYSGWEIFDCHIGAANRSLPERWVVEARGPSHPLCWHLHLLQTGSWLSRQRHTWDLQGPSVWEGLSYTITKIMNNEILCN